MAKKLPIGIKIERYRIKHKLDIQQMCKLMKVCFRTYKALLVIDTERKTLSVVEKKIDRFVKKYMQPKGVKI